MSTINNNRSVGYAIGKTNWYLKTLLSKFLRQEDCGLTTEQWLVLKVIEASPGMSQTEVAQASQKEKTNITRIIDVLEKSGFIERRTDERDRRFYRIHATPKGQEVLLAVNPITRKTEQICTESLTKEQVNVLMDTLEVICRNIKKEL